MLSSRLEKLESMFYDQKRIDKLLTLSGVVITEFRKLNQRTRIKNDNVNFKTSSIQRERTY
jgi:hypothetical protein